MDNWGDPWADNADTTKSPTKSEVTSPLPPAFTPAPALFNGFLDDAGWGNDDGDFGDWSSAPAEEEGADATQTEPTINDTRTPRDLSQDGNHAEWDIEAGSNNHAAHGPSDWAGFDMNGANDDEPVLSESSDTSTTVQANEIAEPIADEPSVPVHADDDTSTRASTSPSETSHNDVPTESPRTSYEEEGADKSPVDVEPTEVSNRSTEGSVVGQDAGEAVLSSSRTTDSEERNEDDSKDEVNEQVDMAEDDAASTSTQSSSSSASGEEATSGKVTTGGERFEVDSDLTEQLFPASKENTKLAEAPEDPIFSISARKAWYRLTRKQTMREYNNGNDDDNYVRVNWASSSIRTEVNNVVGRWAREDRISGTGPGARASFYWDTPAPTESELNAIHARQRSSVSIASASVQRESNAPALSSTAAVAFNWSSPTPTSNPWHQDSPGIRSASSPIAPRHPAVTKVQRQEARAVSVDLTPRQPNAAKHARTLTTNVETPIVPSLVSPPIKNTSTVPTALETWTGFDALDSTAAPKSDSVDAPVDDDDEWGEMVSTPTVSTPTTTEPPSVPALQNNDFPSSATTPQSAKSTSVQDQSPDTMHAAPIVRLRSAISPTSALFKANSFIPMSVEQGPIGPGILKPVSRSSSSTIKKIEKPSTPIEPEPAPASAPAPPPAPKEVARPSTLEDLWSSPADQTPEKATSRVSTPSLPIEPAVVAPARPSTPPLQVTAATQSNIDAWADADFSFFESAPPAAPPRSKKEPSDQPTTLDSPRRSPSVASSTRTFSRSPPRKITPPPVQPLTGATNMAQRRKAEEDQIIELILSGLPDLGYMLR
ncbi:hypothetical protein FB567DRAFT_253066 [Paraphoma chrysanthemicola]|uniref:Uncharacterized protein n=1 Tax=Paraphoma chrysanthemicola TaxID=798071 RepID=A0A8K0VR74_9PLEO|nr:hypothetical protein FB567DRAFT_253066 [Paraphoma chrysanthemicola]